MGVNPLTPYAAIAALGALLLLQTQCHRAERAEQRRDDAITDADSFRRQAELNSATGRAAQRAQAAELRATIEAKEAAHAVSVAPGGDEPLPSAVLELWSSGIDRLRGGQAAAAPDGAGSASVEGGVPQAR